jgi:hypothetical protein
MILGGKAWLPQSILAGISCGWPRVSKRILQVLSITSFEKSPLLLRFSYIADKLNDIDPRRQLKMLDL